MSRSGDDARTGSALVTGAARGIGLAVTRRLAAAGMHVAMVDRDDAALQAAVATLDPSRVHPVACDISDTEAAAGVVRAAASRFGGLTVLVNNAAIYPRRPLMEWSVAGFAEVQRVNVEAAFACSLAAAAVMPRDGSGRIVMMSSITIEGGFRDLVPYVASKAALVGLTRALATELGPTGITVNALAIGAIPTDAEPAGTEDDEVIARQAIRRRGTPEDVADAAMFLAGDGAGFITGQLLYVDGGFGMGG